MHVDLHCSAQTRSDSSIRHFDIFQAEPEKVRSTSRRLTGE
jgi:hypothetical protein